MGKGASRESRGVLQVKGETKGEAVVFGGGPGERGGEGKLHRRKEKLI